MASEAVAVENVGRHVLDAHLLVQAAELRDGQEPHRRDHDDLVAAGPVRGALPDEDFARDPVDRIGAVSESERARREEEVADLGLGQRTLGVGDFDVELVELPDALDTVDARDQDDIRAERARHEAATGGTECRSCHVADPSAFQRPPAVRTCQCAPREAYVPPYIRSHPARTVRVAHVRAAPQGRSRPHLRLGPRRRGAHHLGVNGPEDSPNEGLPPGRDEVAS